MLENPLFTEREPGDLRVGNARMALLDVAAGFWSLRRHLEALVGFRLTNTVLQQAGANGGASFARSFAPDVVPETAVSTLRACIAAYQAAGFGRFSLTELEWPLGRMRLQAEHAFEAWVMQQHAQQTEQPACAYTAGVLVGFVNALTQRRDIVCVEHTCQAQGDPHCTFELLPAADAADTAVVTLDPDPFLSRQLNLLDILFDRMPMGIAIFDRDLALRRCNPTWAGFIDRYTPATAAQVVPGVPFFEILPDLEKDFRPLFAQVLAGEKVQREGMASTSGGITSYWDIVLTPLTDRGQVVAILDVAIDATARVLNRQALQKTVAALQESERNLRSMLENAQGYAIYRVAVDPEKPYFGEVVLVSPSIRDVIGIEDPYDFSAWFTGVHPDDRARVVQANERAMAQGVSFDEAMRFYDRRRQAWRWVHTVSNPIFDENGRLTHFNGITIDVTDQKEAQETLAHLNQVLEKKVRERTREIDRRRVVAESLREILRVLNSKRPLSEILHYIVEQAARLMGSEMCTLHHIDYQARFVRIEASYGLPPEVKDVAGFPLLSSRADELILNREPVVISREESPRLDPEKERSLDPRVRRWRAALTPRYPAFLAVPLVVSGEVYGSLAFYYPSPQPFDRETVDLATSLSEQAALAIDNAALGAKAEEAAVVAERNRLARELHDAVTQTLFSASLIADVLPRIWEKDPEMGRARLAELRELTRGALAEMRTLLLELRPATLTESTLGELLQQLMQAVIGRSRLPVDLRVEGERPLSPDVQVALYRIAQESLHNIVKHAGATRVQISLRFTDKEVELLVTDNGRGFDPAQVGAQSLGLGIMQERAEKIGAGLQIESEIGAGTTIRVTCTDTGVEQNE